MLGSYGTEYHVAMVLPIRVRNCVRQARIGTVLGAVSSPCATGSKQGSKPGRLQYSLPPNVVGDCSRSLSLSLSLALSLSLSLSLARARARSFSQGSAPENRETGRES